MRLNVIIAGGLHLMPRWEESSKIVAEAGWKCEERNDFKNVFT
jgi:hypothetical protein